MVPGIWRCLPSREAGVSRRGVLRMKWGGVGVKRTRRARRGRTLVQCSGVRDLPATPRKGPRIQRGVRYRTSWMAGAVGSATDSALAEGGPAEPATGVDLALP